MGSGLQGFGLLNITTVIVCHCHGVSDRRVRAEAGLGALDADDLAARCGAGSDCGGCLPLIEDLLDTSQWSSITPVQLAS
jgi:bacterioferritin-associated ferredoxin